MLSETDVDSVINRLDECRPSLAIFDSIQTMYCPDVASAPGTVGQVREAGLRLMRWSKARQVPVVLAGHVTKDGAVAGPRTLEHMVDVVISLESQEFGPCACCDAARTALVPRMRWACSRCPGAG